MGSWKAPGPDGYQVGFYKYALEIIGGDLVKMVKNFYTTGTFDSILGKTFVVLIPKVREPSKVEDYRPISLCSCAYRILAKTMVERMKPIVARVITPNQAAFISGRSIMDHVLLVHEALHTFNKMKRKEGAVMIKIDSNKAYDRLSWEFLQECLLWFGFNEHWIRMVLFCVKVTSIHLMINGVPSSQIPTSNGIRQGDPLSPYLFILCQDVLSYALLHLV
ncbi:hypothetical protein ACHQM5_001105 [Ranunculus cassubicifolius]